MDLQDRSLWKDFWPKKKISLGVFATLIVSGDQERRRATSVLPSRSSWRDFWKRGPTPLFLLGKASGGGRTGTRTMPLSDCYCLQ
jgi:hypothetical protein